jgi:hypothetical protein
VSGIKGRHRQTLRDARLRKTAGTFLWEVRPTAAEVSETASANVEFGCQNSNQREARPLPPAKTSEELVARVLNGGLNTIDGGKGQKITSN